MRHRVGDPTPWMSVLLPLPPPPSGRSVDRGLPHRRSIIFHGSGTHRRRGFLRSGARPRTRGQLEAPQHGDRPARSCRRQLPHGTRSRHRHSAAHLRPAHLSHQPTGRMGLRDTVHAFQQLCLQAEGVDSQGCLRTPDQPPHDQSVLRQAFLTGGGPGVRGDSRRREHRRAGELRGAGAQVPRPRTVHRVFPRIHEQAVGLRAPRASGVDSQEAPRTLQLQ